MECDENAESVGEKNDAPEEPGLSENRREDSVVHRVARVAVEPGDDEPLRGIDGGERAAPRREEIPARSEARRPLPRRAGERRPPTTRRAAAGGIRSRREG